MASMRQVGLGQDSESFNRIFMKAEKEKITNSRTLHYSLTILYLPLLQGSVSDQNIQSSVTG